MPQTCSSCSRGDFRLQAQDIAFFYGGVRERLRILDLPARIFVVKFIAEWGAIRPVLRQLQLVHQHRDDAVGWSVVRQFHRDALVLRCIVDRKSYVSHVFWMSYRSAAPVG